MKYLDRGLEGHIRSRLAADRLVILEGARVTGKTSLIEHGLEAGWISQVRSLSDPAQLAAAKAAPRDYVMGLPAGTAIDEAQLFEELTLAVKERIDADERPGQLLLTGSTRLRRNALGGSDPLAGRVGAPLVLRPMTVGERAGQPVNLLARLFEDEPESITLGPPMPRRELLASMFETGIPGMLQLDKGGVSDRAASYIASVTSLQAFESRNVRNMNSLARYLAARTSTLVNVADFSRAVDIARATVDEYLSHLSEALLIHRLPGWRRSKDKSETAKEKIHFFDVGLAAALAELRPEEYSQDFGRMTESFLVGEMLSQAMWTEHPHKLYHWRKNNKEEVDLLVESRDGRVICIEVKSSEQVKLSDFVGLDAFRTDHPERFYRGFVFYAGDTVLPFGEQRWAIPFAALRGDAVEEHPIAELLAGIAERRNKAASADKAKARQTRQFFEATRDSLKALGESLGFPHEVRPGKQASVNKASLVVKRPEGDVVLLELLVNLASQEIHVTVYQSGGGQKPNPLPGLKIGDQPVEQLVVDAMRNATPRLELVVTSWDREDNDR